MKYNIISALVKVSQDSQGVEKRYSILIVDDEKSILGFLETVLEKEGYEVLTAQSGEEALRLFAERPCDLLVCDYQLPGISGLEVVVQAKKLVPGLATIIMTGVGSEQTFIDSITLGKVDFYLPKPFSLNEVKTVVSVVLKDAEIGKKDREFHERLRLEVEEATAELKEKNKLLEQKEKETASLNMLLEEEREHLKAANDRLTRLNEELERLSVTDGLTKLYNFRYFNQRLQDEFQRAKRYDNKLSLVMLDIDDFKQVNDTHGHLAGDEVLRQVANALTTSSRKVDLAVRYGGEEFALLLPEVGLAGAAVRAERLRKSIGGSAIRFNGASISITISAGVATYDPREMNRPEELIGAADEALYRAKDIGKNVVVMSIEERLRAVGKETVVSERECEETLRAIMDFAGSHRGLDGILDFIAVRLGEMLDDGRGAVYVSIRIRGAGGKLAERASLNVYEGAQDLEAMADRVARSGDFEIVDSDSDPVTCIPFSISIDSREEFGEQASGALVMNRIPSCVDRLLSMTAKLAPVVGNAIMLERLETRAGLLSEGFGRYSALSRVIRDLVREGAGASLESVVGALETEIIQTLRARAFSVYTYSSMKRAFTLRFRGMDRDNPVLEEAIAPAEAAMLSRVAGEFEKNMSIKPFIVDDDGGAYVYIGAPLVRGQSLVGALLMTLGREDHAPYDEILDITGTLAAVLPAAAREGVSPE